DRASFIMAVSSHFSISATFFHAQLYENYSSIKYAILFFAGYTWRIVATIITALGVVIFTHKWDIALGVGGLTGLINLILYYFHERLWENIVWGRVKTKKNK
ncbi:MAG: DUF2061 domain-containing protein, partial [Candidatus Levyibacteriota bacterium]